MAGKLNDTVFVLDSMQEIDLLLYPFRAAKLTVRFRS